MIVRDRRPWPERVLAALDRDPDGALARALALPAALFAGAAALRRAWVSEDPLPTGIPSLGVGNLRVGGSGKTPVVEDLGRRLTREGHQVAVLTRGYRSRGGEDEPGWLARSGLSVFADADRRRSFDQAQESGATRILLDDALQTRFRPRWLVAIVLDRDLECAPRPLPAGPAREGAAALRRADALFVRRESGGNPVAGPDALGFRLVPERIVDPAGEPCDPPSGPALLASGLARPESFESDAAAFGLPVAGAWRERDHWNPTTVDRARLECFARDCGAHWILVPEKNLRRVAALDLETPVRALQSRIVWDDDADPLGWLRGRGIGL